jgi:hypothetical protein
MEAGIENQPARSVRPRGETGETVLGERVKCASTARSDSSQGMAETSEESAPAAGIGVCGAGGILPLRCGWGRGVVASTTTANVIDGTVLHLLLAGALAVELVIEGERLLLGREVDIAGTASAAAELGAGLREAVLEERRGTGGRSGVAGLGGLEGIAGAASACVDVVAGGGVRFGDGVVGWHWRCGAEGV